MSALTSRPLLIPVLEPGDRTWLKEIRRGLRVPLNDRILFELLYFYKSDLPEIRIRPRVNPYYVKSQPANTVQFYLAGTFAPLALASESPMAIALAFYF